MSSCQIKTQPCLLPGGTGRVRAWRAWLGRCSRGGGAALALIERTARRTRRAWIITSLAVL